MVLERPASGWRPVAAAIVWGLSMMMADKTPAADNLSFVGNLVAQACSIRPGDEAIELLFDDQSSHYLISIPVPKACRFTFTLSAVIPALPTP